MIMICKKFACLKIFIDGSGVPRFVPKWPKHVLKWFSHPKLTYLPKVTQSSQTDLKIWSQSDLVVSKLYKTFAVQDKYCIWLNIIKQKSDILDKQDTTASEHTM